MGGVNAGAEQGQIRDAPGLVCWCTLRAYFLALLFAVYRQILLYIVGVAVRIVEPKKTLGEYSSMNVFSIISAFSVSYPQALLQGFFE